MKLQYALYAIIVGIFLSLTACFSLTMKQYDDLNTNQRFVLNKPLTIAANSARSYIQNGQRLGSGGFNHREQHCRLEVKNLSDKQQIIHPESFKISSIEIDEEMIAQNKSKQIQLAMNDYAQVQSDVPLLTPINLADSTTERQETMDLVHLNLTSSTQPNVMRLTCSGSLSNGDLQDAPESYRPDLKQINHILGDVAHIE